MGGGWLCCLLLFSPQRRLVSVRGLTSLKHCNRRWSEGESWGKGTAEDRPTRRRRRLVMEEEGGRGRRRVKQKRASCDSLLIAPALVPVQPRASAHSCFPGYTSRHQLRKNVHGRERERGGRHISSSVAAPPLPQTVLCGAFQYTFVLPPCKKKVCLPFSPSAFFCWNACRYFSLLLPAWFKHWG